MSRLERGVRGGNEAGLTLVEVMIALVLMTIGILALGKVLPAGSRSETAARLQGSGALYANETFETLRGQARVSSSLTAGRHPSSGYDSLGTSKAWRRYYVVSAMSSPLDSLLKVQAIVRWGSVKPDSVTLTGYLMP